MGVVNLVAAVMVAEVMVAVVPWVEMTVAEGRRAGLMGEWVVRMARETAAAAVVAEKAAAAMAAVAIAEVATVEVALGTVAMTVVEMAEV